MTDKYYRIVLDSQKAEAGAKRFDVSMRGAGRSVDNFDGGISRVRKSSAGLTTTLRPLAAAIAAVLSVRKVVDYTDAWTSAQNQLRQVTKTHKQLSDVSQVLLQVSNETRSSFEASTKLYSTLSRSTQELNISSGRLIGITKTVNQLFAASGATAQESSNAIRQLSQGLASGALRGDEFNSVAEQAPGIMRAISAETGLTIGQLRDFAAEGKISSELLIKSLENYQGEAAKAAALTEQTFGQSLVIARNNAIAIAGGIDAMGDAASGAGKLIADLTGELAAMSQSGQIDAGIQYVGAQFVTTGQDITNLLNDLLRVYAEFSSEMQLDSLDISGAFTNIVPNIRSMVQIAGTELAHLASIAGVSGPAIADALNVFDDISVGQSVDNLKADIERLNTVRVDSIGYILAERDIALAANDAQIASIKTLRLAHEAKNKTLLSGDSLGGFAPPKNDGGAPKSAPTNFALEKLKNETDLMANELALRGQLQETSLASLLSNKQTYAEKERAVLEYSIEQQEISAYAQYDREATALELKQVMLLENQKINDTDKLAMQTEYQTQKELLADQHSLNLINIEQRGAAAKIQIAEQERIAKISAYTGLAGGMLSLVGAFGKKSIKQQKSLAVLETGIAITAGAAKALNNPYPANLAFAAQVLAQGASLKNRLDSIGSGPSVPSLPSMSSHLPASHQSSRQSGSGTQTTHKRVVVELVGLNDEDYIKGAQVKSLMREMMKDTDVILDIHEGTQNAKRTGDIDDD